MTNRFGKIVDKTFLSVDNAETRGFIHRDYIAHCLRWSHVIKYLSKGQLFKNARILDVGCGRETPLAKMLYSSKMAPDYYLGIDAGKINDFNFGKYNDRFEFFEQEDFATMSDLNEVDNFDVITCFEVLEHVEPLHAGKILRRIRTQLSEDGYAFISTPCFNGKAAGNHVNEMTYEAFYNLLGQTGFDVSRHWGTFASITDYKHLMSSQARSVFDMMRDYFDVNVLSCLFAPLYPNASRNVLWKVAKDVSIEFRDWDTIKKPWSSSEKWEDLKNA